MTKADSGRHEGDEDARLFVAYAKGDLGAFDALYRKYRSGVFRHIYRMVGNRATAEEIHNEVWITVIKRKKDYEPKSKFVTFLNLIARSRVIEYYRKTGRMVSTSSMDEETGLVDSIGGNEPNQLDVALSAEMVTRFKECLQTLPDAQRIVFIYREEAELAWAEIAEFIAAPPETARARHRYAVDKLRHCMGDLCPVK
jgi:RNA polymerase sigma-70 factor (ECF subfamily)